MKTILRTILLLLSGGWLAVGLASAQTIAPTIILANPTNGAVFLAPANLYVHAQWTDSNAVKSVQYFAITNANSPGTSPANRIGLVTNNVGVVETNLTQGNSLPMTWSNVTAGVYTLSAIATDSAGLSLTSAPVTITVTNAVLRPSVYIYSPTNTAHFAGPTNLMLYARAVETPGAIANVQFFANNLNLGSVPLASQAVFTNLSSEPLFRLLWSNAPPGTYSLTAVATDTNNNSSTSSVVSITVTTNSVTSPTNLPFVVSFWYPTNGQSFAAPATIGVHALVTDSNVVQSMSYYANGVAIGSVRNTNSLLLTNSSQGSPFFLAWSNVTAGTYSLTAVALDSASRTATSSVVNITVTNPPTITTTNPVVRPSLGFYSPTNGAVFPGPTNLMLYVRAAESTGTVATVQFFENNVSLGIVSNAAQAVFTNISTEPLFALLWSNAPSGSYALTALATDTLGNTATSSVVNITVTNPPAITTNPPARPSVYIYSPTNNARFAGPANLTLYARAAESTGTVATVQFFANNLSLGVVSNAAQAVFTNISSAPLFALLWSNAPSGSYALTALATDTLGNTATSSVVNITLTTNVPPVPVPFAVSFWYPTNGQSFLAPAAIGVHALATDSNVVKSVTYFANGGSIGTVANPSSVLLTNLSQDSPFFLNWTNVAAGNYALTAVALDTAGNTATSSVVNVTVTNRYVPLSILLANPLSGQSFLAGVNLYVHAQWTDINPVKSVQYYASASPNTLPTLIGTAASNTGVVETNLTQGNSLYLTWSNVPAGSYSLSAIATDSTGLSLTSAPVNITVTNLIIPYTVSFWYPTNGQLFTAPATVGLHALVTDSNAVRTMQYFANGTSVGIVSNSTGVLLTSSTAGNPFFLSWSNVTAGTYSLTAQALDSAGLLATSAPVTLFVVTSLPPAITIYASDPVAVEGTNYPAAPAGTVPSTTVTNYVTGTNTATFVVNRTSQTNASVTVSYSVGGTAIPGYDYVELPGTVTIPAGKTYALVTVYPLPNQDPTYLLYDTVVLTLQSPTNSPSAPPAPPAYTVGSPGQAGAIILEDNYLPIQQAIITSLEDNTLHISLPATNGLNYCLEVSTNLINWVPVLTNTVLKGSAQYVDPTGPNAPSLYYRIAPVSTPASY